jgi:hypothetical protein
MSAEINCAVFVQNYCSALEAQERVQCKLKSVAETAFFHIWKAKNNPRRIVFPKQGGNHDHSRGFSTFGVLF